MCIICFLFNFGYYKYALLRIKRETVLIIPKKNMEANYIYKGDDMAKQIEISYLLVLGMK